MRFYEGIRRGCKGLVPGDWEGDMGAGTGRAKCRNQDEARGTSGAGAAGSEHGVGGLGGSLRRQGWGEPRFGGPGLQGERFSRPRGRGTGAGRQPEPRGAGSGQGLSPGRGGAAGPG